VINTPLTDRTAPDWARWNGQANRPWSVQIAEDAMLVEPERGVLAALEQGSLARRGGMLTAHTSDDVPAVITLMTERHESAAAAASELALLREELADTLAHGYGLAAVSTGLHPWSEPLSTPQWEPEPLRPRPVIEVRPIVDRLDPSGSLRIDVAVPDPEAAVRVLDGLRAQLPLLLALSANSPFWRGRFTGMASARAALRGTLTHGGLPRRFGSYRTYVAAVDALLRAHALHHAGGIDWDARLRPERGVVEVGVMDAQVRVSDVIGIAALVQCLVRLHAEREPEPVEQIPELLLENRAAAVAKGMRAELIDSSGHFTHRATDELSILLEGCAPIARELDCSHEVAGVTRTAADSGYMRQRRAAAAGGLKGVVRDLSAAFTEPLFAAAWVA
jgi:carboxylate-amine ligase